MPADAAVELCIGGLQQILHILYAPRLDERIAQHVAVGCIVDFVKIVETVLPGRDLHVPLPPLLLDCPDTLYERQSGQTVAQNKTKSPVGAQKSVNILLFKNAGGGIALQRAFCGRDAGRPCFRSIVRATAEAAHAKSGDGGGCASDVQSGSEQCQISGER